MPAEHDGGALKGGAPRAVWFTSESDPSLVSARSVAQELRCRRQAAHLVWNPLVGDIVQMVSVTRAGSMLAGTAGNEGRVCAQIMVVGNAGQPFTDGPLSRIEQIIAWLDSWHVPHRWPAGPPLPPPQSYSFEGDRRSWARGGHFGCSQVPGSRRPDPGRIDIWKITGPDHAATGIPQQRAATAPESMAGLPESVASARSAAGAESFAMACGALLQHGNGSTGAVAGIGALPRAAGTGERTGTPPARTETVSHEPEPGGHASSGTADTGPEQSESGLDMPVRQQPVQEHWIGRIGEPPGLLTPPGLPVPRGLPGLHEVSDLPGAEDLHETRDLAQELHDAHDRPGGRQQFLPEPVPAPASMPS